MGIEEEKIVSIHALVKRATYTGKTKDALKIVSIHALVKRATFLFCKKKLKNVFQSTPS